MKLKQDINYGIAFDMLKDAMREAKEFEKDYSDTTIPGANYVKAYAKLSAVTEVVLNYVEDKETNDIPETLFNQS